VTKNADTAVLVATKNAEAAKKTAKTVSDLQVWVGQEATHSNFVTEDLGTDLTAVADIESELAEMSAWIENHLENKNDTTVELQDPNTNAEVEGFVQTEGVEHTEGSLQAAPTASACWRKDLLLYTLWLPIAFFLASPMGLAMLSLSLPPGENVLHLDEAILRAVQFSMGAVLYVIKSYPIPKCARTLARWVYSNNVPQNTAGSLMMLGNFILAVVIPVGTLIFINGDCFGGWMWLWSRCQSPTSFDISVDQVVGEFHYNSERYWDVAQDMWKTTRSVGIHVNVSITSHREICEPAYVADGRCPRALVQALGNLYARDLCFAAGLGAVLTFIRATPPMQRVKGWLVRTLLCRATYEPRTSPDRMVTSAVLLLELPLVLGFCYPILPAVAALAMLFNAGSFRVCVEQLGVKLTDDAAARVSIKYLFVSLGLGYALPLWLFFEGDFAGKWIVLFGWPITAYLTTKFWLSAREQGGSEQTLHEKYMYEKYTYRPGLRKSLPHVDDVLWRPYKRKSASDDDNILTQEKRHDEKYPICENESQDDLADTQTARQTHEERLRAKIEGEYATATAVINV